MTSTLPPWTQIALPHDDVRDEQAVKAEYAVNLGKIDRNDPNVPRNYADPRAFFEATYLTDDLRRLLSDAMAALSGKNVDRVLQLRTPFGGGKSHTLVGLYHLAKSRAKLAGLKDLAAIPDPGAVRVAALPCADLSPGLTRAPEAGVKINTLWGELAYRLGGREGFEVVRPIDEVPSAPGQEVIEQLLEWKKGATLILADEVLVYVEKAMAVKAGDSSLGRQTLTFLMQLTEAVAGDPKAALVYSLQASVGEAMGAEGLLDMLDKLVGRVDARRVPVQDRQVREIIRRRLFKSLGDESARKRVAEAFAEQHRQFLISTAETKADKSRVDEEAKRVAEDILAAYPFHPGLIRLMYERWGSLPSYQRTRGALQFLGTVVHVLFKRGHAGPLIGPGDVPLDDPDVRSEFFRQVGEREKWDSVLDADVATERARARRVDRRIGEASPALLQARVGTTTATALTLYSFGARKDELRGVDRMEVISALLRPGVEPPTVDAALGDLREALLYLHVSGGRFRMDTIPSLTKLIEEAIAAVDADDVIRRIRTTLEGMVGSASSAILWPEHAGRIPDRRREFLFAYLPLEWAENSSERNETMARELLVRTGSEKGGKRRFRNGVAFVLPQKAQTEQARALARRVQALEGLKRKAKANHIQVSAEQKDEIDEKLKDANRDFDGACRAIYAQVLLPTRGKEKKDEDGDPLSFRSVELGGFAANEANPHGRLLELLKRHVFAEVTTDRFVEILGLGTGGTPKFIPLSEALDSFFSFLDHPKMRSEDALLAALADAVAAQRLGYVPAARVEADQITIEPSVAIRFGSSHEPEEFSDEGSAFLVAADLARDLVAAQKPSTTRFKTVESPTPVKGVVRPVVQPPEPTTVLPPPVAKGTKGTRFVLTARAETKQSWFKLASALNELAGKAAGLTVKVEVEATQPSGFDPVYLRNKVKEVLEENGIPHTDVLAKE